MSTVREWCARFVSTFKNTALDREFDDEAQSHLDLATEEYVARGMPLAEARRLARVQFGSTSVSKDVHRDSRGLPWLEARCPRGISRRAVSCMRHRLARSRV